MSPRKRTVYRNGHAPPVEERPEERPAGQGDEWGTPRPLFLVLEEEAGGYDLDAAASPENALCRRFFTKEDDALAQDWSPFRIVFVNPPYSDLKPWLAKARAAVLAPRGEDTATERVDLLVKYEPGRKYWRERVLGDDGAGRFYGVHFDPAFAFPQMYDGETGEMLPRLLAVRHVYAWERLIVEVRALHRRIHFVGAKHPATFDSAVVVYRRNER